MNFIIDLIKSQEVYCFRLKIYIKDSLIIFIKINGRLMENLIVGTKL